MDWSKIKLPRRGFCRALGASALTLWCGHALAKGNSDLSTKDNQSIKDSKTMPVLYIPHGGGPCFFMEWTMGPRDTWDGMGAWLKQLGSTVPEKPKAIVLISAHWEESAVAINKLIDDYNKKNGTNIKPSMTGMPFRKKDKK